MSTQPHHPAVPSPAPPPAPLKAMDFAAKSDWPGYFKSVLGKPARETTLKAIELFEREAAENTRGAGDSGTARHGSENRATTHGSESRGTGRSGSESTIPNAPHSESGATRYAVDLAAGEGRDTLELLRRGWTVLAIEMLPEGITLLRDRVPAELRSRLHTQVASYADAWWPPCDLLNCSFALPFCPADQFDSLWSRIIESIRPGGRFAGQLFGDRDSWGRCGHTLGHSRAVVERLFATFELEQFSEEEKDDVTAAGTPKHWHVFHIVARKR